MTTLSDSAYPNQRVADLVGQNRRNFLMNPISKTTALGSHKGIVNQGCQFYFPSNQRCADEEVPESACHQRHSRDTEQTLDDEAAPSLSTVSPSSLWIPATVPRPAASLSLESASTAQKRPPRSDWSDVPVQRKRPRRQAARACEETQVCPPLFSPCCASLGACFASRPLQVFRILSFSLFCNSPARAYTQKQPTEDTQPHRKAARQPLTTERPRTNRRQDRHTNKETCKSPHRFPDAALSARINGIRPSTAQPLSTASALGLESETEHAKRYKTASRIVKRGEMGVMAPYSGGKRGKVKEEGEVVFWQVRLLSSPALKQEEGEAMIMRIIGC
eukprot:2386675-Rhodomonas_salina.2